MKISKNAFTIIELMISLIIFWSWLLFVLVILNKNVLLSKQIELKSKWTILSKEWIEIVFNKRDSNNIKYQPWNYITWNLTDGIKNNDVYFEKWKSYQVWTDFLWYENNINEISYPYLSNSKLYLKTWQLLNKTNKTVYSWFYYNYSTWEQTAFSRYASFTWVYTEPESNILSKDAMKLNSIVRYNWWWISWEVILESIVTNWK